MTTVFTPEELDEALANCESEPVHIPGTIQPVGALIAGDAATGIVSHASENAPRILRRDMDALLGASVKALLGASVWHDVRNAAGLPSFSIRREPVGTVELAAGLHDVHAFASGDRVVIEIEAAADGPILAPVVLREVTQLLDSIRQTDGEQALLATTVRLLRTLTGYDRVMAYRFDQDFNGEVMAEARKARLTAYLGLRFPHWDIPAQARAIMQTVPLRFISDVDQVPVPIIAKDQGRPPLDLTLANLRGVSPVHMQYLRNMGTRATMTLSVVNDDRLWGMLAFHHGRPRVPTAHVRQVCGAFLPFFETRLALNLKNAELALASGVERLRDRVQGQIDADLSLEKMLGGFAPQLLAAFEAHGIVLQTGGRRHDFGVVPGDALLSAVIADARAHADDVVSCESLAERFPDLPADRNGLAGALTMPLPERRAVLIFREGRDRRVRWAGAPERAIEVVDGMTRLSPRGSFALYIETVKDRADPWLPRDVELARRVGRTLVAYAERQSTVAASSRQQALMIDELNHRVRNILALIRSVSRQARRHNASLDSYSKALEQRIHALASAHNIGAGQAASAVSLKKLIALEAEPHSSDVQSQVRVAGEDGWIKADLAPILALVIHELMTNAAKYGALSDDHGRVEIQLDPVDEGLRLSWTEHSGPAVSAPSEHGFGVALIEQAIPFELGGRSELSFEPAGVRAELWLPGQAFDAAPRGQTAPPGPTIVDEGAAIPPSTLSGMVLLIEDNYIIATDLADMLRKIGFAEIEVASSVPDGLEIVEQERPSLAILDINLGPGRGTSLELADHLAELRVPILFVSGYGERTRLPGHLAGRPILTKPVATEDLRRTIANLQIGDG